MAFSEKKPDAYLNTIRNEFRKQEVMNSKKGLGWGQFLDIPNGDAPVGVYGTSAALLAFSMGSGAVDAKAQPTRQSLVDNWSRRAKDPDVALNFNQNIKLAWVLLSFGKNSQYSDPLIQEITLELFRRRIPNENLWGDADGILTVSEYASSIILILLKAFRYLITGTIAELDSFDQDCKIAAQALQKKFLDDRNRSRPYKLAMLIAINLHVEKADRAVAKSLKNLLYERIDLGARYTYFFDQKKSQTEYQRDYFIFPLTLVVPFLLFQTNISGTNYLFATRVLGALENSLSMEQGLYKDGVSRVSTLEQGIVSVVLEAANIPRPNRLKTWLANVRYILLRDGARTRLAAIFILIVFYIPAGLLTAATEIADTELVKTHFSASLLSTLVYLGSAPKWLVLLFTYLVLVIGEPQEIIKSALFGKKNK